VVNQACAIVMALLSCERIDVRRVAMLIHASRRDECSAWSALHYGARSGTLAFVYVRRYAVLIRPLQVRLPLSPYVRPFQGLGTRG
jgi:hypothetical protein